jgi:hypothetical protein
MPNAYPAELAVNGSRGRGSKFPFAIRDSRGGTAEFRAYIRAEVNSLLAAAGFTDALPGYLLPDAASQARISIVIQRLEELASP